MLRRDATQVGLGLQGNFVFDVVCLETVDLESPLGLWSQEEVFLIRGESPASKIQFNILFQSIISIVNTENMEFEFFSRPADRALTARRDDEFLPTLCGQIVDRQA